MSRLTRVSAVSWILVAALFLSAVFCVPPSFAQEKPEQTGLSPIGDPLTHIDDPAFAFAVPKKKKLKEIRERWRIVDLELRKTTALEKVEKANEEEKGRESPDDQRLLELQAERAQIIGFYTRSKFLLEIDGDPAEWIRVDLQPKSKRNIAIAEAQPRKILETKWSRVEIQRDQETTTKADKKKGRQSHILMLLGTPENSKDRGWWRIETRLIPSKDGTKLFQLTYIHRMPADRFGKNSMKESELLSHCLLIP